jgi:hypothetical protein
LSRSLNHRTNQKTPAVKAIATKSAQITSPHGNSKKSKERKYHSPATQTIFIEPEVTPQHVEFPSAPALEVFTFPTEVCQIVFKLLGDIRPHDLSALFCVILPV